MSWGSRNPCHRQFVFPQTSPQMSLVLYFTYNQNVNCELIAKNQFDSSKSLKKVVLYKSWFTVLIFKWSIHWESIFFKWFFCPLQLQSRNTWIKCWWTKCRIWHQWSREEVAPGDLATRGATVSKCCLF